MDESLGGMIKLTRPNYSIWKSKMRDMLMCKDMWLPVRHGTSKPENIDASTWEAMHIKTTSYIRCFIDMSLCNNFGDETKPTNYEGKSKPCFRLKTPKIESLCLGKL